MSTPEIKRLSTKRDAIAPDGSEVRVLLAIPGAASTAHFKLKPGQISKAVTHKTVSEIWYVLKGRGKIWRGMNGAKTKPDNLVPGQCITLPLGTHFQFRASPSTSLEVFGVTTPPWPTDREEAIPVEGIWKPNV